jgi:hypothetical protein
LIAALHDIYGSKKFKSSYVFDLYSQISNWKRKSDRSLEVTTQQLALYDALEGVLGSRRVDAKAFGYWARRVKGQHLRGFMLETHHDGGTKTNYITVRKT